MHIERISVLGGGKIGTSLARGWVRSRRFRAGEITEREPYNGYLIFQGGIPEVEEFIRKFHK